MDTLQNNFLQNKKTGILLIGAVVLVFVIALFFGLSSKEDVSDETLNQVQGDEMVSAIDHRVIGSSVEGRNIEVYTFGTGTKHLLFVGGIHGGYEWNSILLAHAFIDYLTESPEVVGELKVSVIPDLNPDGTFKVIGKEGRFALADGVTVLEKIIPGRFNANDVDLNRNFDCKWQPESVWRGNVVSAGAAAFSEPEARVLRDFVLNQGDIEAVVMWHSKANAVYASECENGILPKTLDILHAYGVAADYRPVEVFDAYPITGDAEGWLASIGISAITVELETRDQIEWERNKAGVEAVLDLYRN